MARSISLPSLLCHAFEAQHQSFVPIANQVKLQPVYYTDRYHKFEPYMLIDGTHRILISAEPDEWLDYEYIQKLDQHIRKNYPTAERLVIFSGHEYSIRPYHAIPERYRAPSSKTGHGYAVCDHLGQVKEFLGKPTERDLVGRTVCTNTVLACGYTPQKAHTEKQTLRHVFADMFMRLSDRMFRNSKGSTRGQCLPDCKELGGDRIGRECGFCDKHALPSCGTHCGHAEGVEPVRVERKTLELEKCKKSGCQRAVKDRGDHYCLNCSMAALVAIVFPGGLPDDSDITSAKHRDEKGDIAGAKRDDITSAKHRDEKGDIAGAERGDVKTPKCQSCQDPVQAGHVQCESCFILESMSADPVTITSDTADARHGNGEHKNVEKKMCKITKDGRACDREADPGNGISCLKHHNPTCVEAGCFEVSCGASGIGFLCKNHVSPCKAIVDGKQCTEIPAGTMFCKAHSGKICRELKCMRVQQQGEYCLEHRDSPCAKYGTCYNRKGVMCSSCRPAKCQRDDCNLAKAYGLHVCELHKTCAESKCSYPAYKGPYCETHTKKCASNYCRARPKDNFTRCAVHLVMCRARIGGVPCEKEAVKGQHLCADHNGSNYVVRCKHADCDYEHVEGSPYCAAHM